MKNICFIVGSLRKESFNLQLAQQASKLLEGKANVSFLDYHDIPYMNQDIEFPTPDSIQALRDQVKKADGIWIFSPEYNHFFPGVLKNLLDWLSRPEADTKKNVLAGKPVALSGITPGMSGTGIAQDHLVTLLSFLNMKVMNAPRLTIPNAFDQAQGSTLVLTSSLPFLEKQAQAFLEFLG